MSDAKQRAFVLMPFDPAFDSVYGLFIASVLAEAGYDVFRADDIRSQGSIIRDVIDSILHSDLIVADLTNSNPNVYYELGLAHAFQRPVILLTQNTSDLPFDLRSYRVIRYDTDFSQINRARGELLEYARLALRRELLFGNPVTDFGGLVPPTFHVADGLSESRVGVATPGEVLALQNAEQEPLPTEHEDDLGLLDYIIRMNEGFESLAGVLEGATSDIKSIGEQTAEATSEINRAMESQSEGTVKHVHKVVRRLGERLSDFAQSTAGHNAEYRQCLKDIGSSLEVVVRSASTSTEADRDALAKFDNTLDGMEAGSRGGHASIVVFLDVLKGLPRIERTFERARRTAVDELQAFADNIEQTVALSSRARTVAAEKLAGTPEHAT